MIALAARQGRDVMRLLPKVIGPFDQYCSGCPLSPEAAYVTAPFIGIGVIRSTQKPGISPLERILAFDRAEAEWANLTQTNLVTVSSFNGIQGLLLGYDLLKSEQRPHPLVMAGNTYDAEPLFLTTRMLLGPVRQKRFPIAPGQHLLCATKIFFSEGPSIIYGAMAIGIPEHRDRNAELFMEDHGVFSATPSTERVDIADQRRVLEDLVDAVKRIGENVGVAYREIFLGIRVRQVGRGEVGCVLTAAPYIHLARNAVPATGIELLASMSQPSWEVAVRRHFLGNNDP